MRLHSARALFPAAVLLWTAAAGRLAAAPVISEFLAVNRGPEVDAFGATSDWIEIHNPGPEAVELAGWSLSDDAARPGKWVFPAVLLDAGGFLLVRASGVSRPGPELHAGFALSGDGGFLGLYAPDGVCASCWESYARQFGGVSFGTASGSGAAGYFAVPTPGAENGAEVLAGSVRETKAGAARGFYDAPFTVTLTTATPGASIRYTLDGSEPGPDHGLLYTGPVPVTSTTVLRSRAFLDGWLPSDTGTWSYLFASGWKAQPEFPAGFSRTWGQSSSVRGLPTPAKYRMSPAVTQSPVYGPLIIPALTTTLPVLCVTGDPALIFGDEGLHGNLRRTDTEIPAAVEFFDPQHPEDRFAVRAGLQMHGGAVRDHAKRAFRLDFTGVHGDGPLRHPLLPGGKAETFDQLVLRPGGHDGFAGRSRDTAMDALDLSWHATLLRDPFLRLTENAVGLMSPRGRYVHLSLNGLYWGVYDLLERPNAEYCAEQSGGSPADWDVLHHNNVSGDLGPQVIDGDLEAWQALQALAAKASLTDADYRAAAALLGPGPFIDHLLIRMWAGDHDWLGPAYAPGVTGNVALQNSKNWYAVRPTRSVAGGPWRFFTWDGEISMGSNLLPWLLNSPSAPPDLLFPAYAQRKLDLDLTGISRANTPAALWASLRRHPEFRLAVADRARRLLFHGGVLTPGAVASRITALAGQLDLAVVAESARWSGLSAPDYIYTSSPLPLRDSHWRPEVAWLRDTFAVQRAEIFLNQLKAGNLYPAAEPVTVSPAGGEVAADTPITLSAGGAVIYYTTDGSDPREPFTDGVSPSARIYEAPLTTGGVSPFRLNTRAYNGEWSALTGVDFSGAAEPEPGELAVTELYYHPSPATAEEVAVLGARDPGAFEFLEITNVSSRRLALDRLQFAAGIDFDFAADCTVRELAPGERLVLASEADALTVRFGVVPAGVFAHGTGLSNGGESLRLVRAGGPVIFDFSWGDGARWPAGADGGGFSLHLLAPLSGTNPDVAENWRADVPSPGVLPGPLRYPEWVRDHFTAGELADGAGSGILDDPDGDGLANLVEFLTKSDPRRASAPPVRVEFPEPGVVRYRWERRVDVEDGYEIGLQSGSGAGWVRPPVTAVFATGRATEEVVQDQAVPGLRSHFSRLRAAPVTR